MVLRCVRAADQNMAAYNHPLSIFQSCFNEISQMQMENLESDTSLDVQNATGTIILPQRAMLQTCYNLNICFEPTLLSPLNFYLSIK